MKDDESKIDKEFIGKVVGFMADWSEKNPDPLCTELFHMILIVKNGATSIARKSLNGLNPFRIEIFNQEELLVNITKHEMVPRHKIISKTEKDQLLKKYRVKESQLPKI